MNNLLTKLLLSKFFLFVVVLGAVLAVFLGFLFGLGNPAAWIGLAVLAGIPFAHKRLIEGRYVRWDDRFSTGVELIDNDHKQLVNLLNQLVSSMYYSTGKDFVMEALRGVVDYTEYHFGREEQLMNTHGYPQGDEHKAEHAEMISRAHDFFQRLERGDEDVVVHEAHDYLKGWLINHICSTDRKLGAYLNEQGVR